MLRILAHVGRTLLHLALVVAIGGGFSTPGTAADKLAAPEIPPGLASYVSRPEPKFRWELRDKKTVNGVRCREWLVTMRGAPGGLEHDTVCLGLEDGLPYEATIDWQHARANFSDYNAPIQFDLPEAAVQATGATAQNP